MLHIVAAENCISVVWREIIKVLSMHETGWTVDCLDSLYESNLKPGFHSTDRLLYELKDNTYIFAARMLGCPGEQPLDQRIVTINDYYNSSCESVVLCADGVHFEVFSKCCDRLMRLMNAFIHEDVKKIEWMDDALCGRFELTV